MNPIFKANENAAMADFMLPIINKYKNGIK